MTIIALKENVIAGSRARPERCDPRAWQVAARLKEQEDPELLILFGSRARGDWEEDRSDIDLMLVLDRKFDWDDFIRIDDAARALAREIYGENLPIQTNCYTAEEFHRMRRSRNHVTKRALLDGILMPRNPEDYQVDFEDDDDLDYEWTVADERLRHAESHLKTFNEWVDNEAEDFRIGQEAHSAMEHALKALISVNGQEYPTVHDIGILTHRARRADPEFDLIQRVDPRYYNQYAGRDEYKPAPRPLSRREGYAQLVNEDVRNILDRAWAIRELRRPAE